MENSLPPLTFHVILKVDKLLPLIKQDYEASLYQHIESICQKRGHNLLGVNGFLDHIHFVFVQNPDQPLMELVQNIKKETSFRINQQRYMVRKFKWSKGCAIFSVNPDHLEKRILPFIQSQKKHHQVVTFKEEYRKVIEDEEIVSV